MMPDERSQAVDGLLTLLFVAFVVWGFWWWWVR